MTQAVVADRVQEAAQEGAQDAAHEQAHEQAQERAQEWATVKRVLAVRLDNLGDLLMTTPALAALRSAWPAARITLLTSPAAAGAAPHLQMIDETITFAAPWVKAGADAGAAPGDAELKLIGSLRDRAFDAAVIFTVCTQSALPAAMLCRLAGIPLRLAVARENPYALLTDWVREVDEPLSRARHEVRRQLALVASVGARTPDTRLRWRIREPDQHEALHTLAAAGLPAGARFLLIHPGASAASRRWLPQRFGAAADAVADATGCALVFCGELADAPRVQAAQDVMRHRSLSVVGRLSLGGLAAVIARAAVMLANNSGPAHLAAAVGTPVVVLYALTNPQHTPWGVAQRVLAHDVDCRWCLRSTCARPGHDCLSGVAAEQAAGAALELMREAAHAHGNFD